MKENEAPDKIYVHRSKHIKRLCASAAQGKGDIEYTRTDAFIDKAENYLRNKCQRFILTEKDIEDFVKFMKGE